MNRVACLLVVLVVCAESSWAHAKTVLIVVVQEAASGSEVSHALVEVKDKPETVATLLVSTSQDDGEATFVLSPAMVPSPAYVVVTKRGYKPQVKPLPVRWSERQRVVLPFLIAGLLTYA